MFGSIGPMELFLIFVVALLVFGPRKLPELGKSLGKGLSEFRKASHELRSTLEEEVRAEEVRKPVERLERALPAAAGPSASPVVVAAEDVVAVGVTDSMTPATAAASAPEVPPPGSAA